MLVLEEILEGGSQALGPLNNPPVDKVCLPVERSHVEVQRQKPETYAPLVQNLPLA
jgi:hypothetical protein